MGTEPSQNFTENAQHRTRIHIGGVLRSFEIAGPSDAHAWSECSHLLTTALVGFGAVGLGPILDYWRICTPIRRVDVGSSVSDGRKMPTGTHGAPARWSEITQLPHHATSLFQHRLTRADRGTPCGVPAVDHTVDWHRQFEGQALLVITKAGRFGDVVTGEAPIAATKPLPPPLILGTAPDTKRRK